MRKIKFLLAVLFATTVAFCGMAANPTQEDLENYQASLISYIKTEGYTPKLDADGDIAFKHDGDSYWVQVSTYDDGYYVTVMTQTSIEDFDINQIRRAMDDAVRSLKYVRMYSSSDRKYVTVAYSWYCVSVVDFKRMFENALSVVSTCDSRFIKNLID